MNEYVPFLKFKTNEVAAIKALESELKNKLTPFFDFPRKDAGTTALELKNSIDALHRKYEINLKCLPYFYIDNYDIDDSLKINGNENYIYILEKFSDANIIPVIGIDRTDSRNSCVFDCKHHGVIESEFVAVRVTKEDFESYDLIADEIEELLEKCDALFNGFHLIVDNRVCNGDIEETSDKIVDFLRKIKQHNHFERIIVTGSSIPASIRDILEPESDITIDRREVAIARSVNDKVKIDFGDYACVSPDYSDVTVGGGIIRRITAPKLFYPYDDQLFVIRGGALDTHPRGNAQYEDLSDIIIKKRFYRQPTYSFGDKYLSDKAQAKGNDATPSTVPKPLINLHISFILNDFSL